MSVNRYFSYTFAELMWTKILVPECKRINAAGGELWTHIIILHPKFTCLPTLAVCPSMVDTRFCAAASQICTRPLCVPTATRPLWNTKTILWNQNKSLK